MITRNVMGTVIALPINFPDEVEIRLVPHSKKTGLAFDGSFPILPHRSWEWVTRFYPARVSHWAVCEAALREGRPATIHFGEFPIEFENESHYPDYLED